MQTPLLDPITAEELADGDLIIVRDVSVTASTSKDKRLAWSELVSAIESSLGSMATEDAADYQAVSEKDQPDGYAGLDENGQLIGPVIISVYANAAAAGVLADGTLAKVGDALALGDGSTTGGNLVGLSLDNPTGYTNSVAVEATAGRALLGVNSGGVTLTITNAHLLQDGYLLYINMLSDTALIFGNDGGAYSPTGQDGLHTFMKVGTYWYLTALAAASGG